MKLKTSKTEQPSHTNLEECDYETAIEQTGFGKFNILLLLIATPAGWTSMLESSSMSYVFPVAQCDLELSLQNKGMLNAASYIGMICSAFFWGLVADNWGRKKLLVLGYLLDAFFIIVSGFSQSYTMLLICKLFGGFIINGPYAALVAYLAEFHSAKHRTRIVIIRGLMVHSAKFVLPLLAWAVFPLNINHNFFSDQIVLRSWSYFLFLCGIPSLFSGFLYMFMPETPKFLMAKGENQKAMEVFSLIYSLNTGKPRDSYPIKTLLKESRQSNPSDSKSVFHTALKQARQLFSSEYLWYTILVCIIQLGIVFSGNPIRLWLPQIFTAINDYHIRYNDTTASLCDILETVQSSGETKVAANCEVNVSGNFLYVNTLIVAGVCLLGFIISTTVVNYVGKKLLLVLLALCCGLLITTMYFSKSTGAILALASIVVTNYNVCISLVNAFVVDLFPTTVRTLILAVSIASSRVGAVLGNLLFPVVLQSGCLTTFLVFGSTAIGAGILSLLLPNTYFKALQ